MKCIIYPLVFILLHLVSISAHAQTATPPAAGNGTSGSPYQIANLENLYWIAQDPTRWASHYTQTASIDASATSTWNGGQGWSPIGNTSTFFTGSYDGYNLTISNLTINRPNANYVGLFGITDGASIRNVNLHNVSISGQWDVGSIIGSAWSSQLSSCNASIISMVGISAVGGIVGSSYSSSIHRSSSSYAQRDASLVSGAWSVGGICGYSDYSSLSESYSTVNVSANQYGGGLMGYLWSGGITNSYATGSVYALYYAGGIVGEIGGDAAISTSYSHGTVSGSSSVGGLVGFSEAGVQVVNSYWNIESSGQTGSDRGIGLTTTAMTQSGSFAGFDFVGVWSIIPDQSYPYLQWQGGALAHNYPSRAPTVTTGTISAFASTSATGGGSITSDGGTPITAHGLVWSTQPDPHLTNNNQGSTLDASPRSGAFSFEHTIPNLTPGTTYYVRAYATNSAGTAYGSQVEFTTSPANTFTVHYNNPNDWQDVYIWVWEGSTNLFTLWPGELMRPPVAGSSWWSYHVPVGYSGILFSNGAQAQTQDLFRSTTGWFDGVQWHDQEPQAELPKDIPTIFRFQTPVTIGTNDSRWSLIAPNYIDRGAGTINKENSHWKMGWTDNSLFLRVVVEDDIFCNQWCTGNIDQDWLADRIDLYLNVSGNLNPPDDHGVGMDPYSSGYLLVASLFQQRDQVPPEWINIFILDYLHAYSFVGSTITYEFEIPWSILTTWGFTLVDGAEFGVDVNYTDWDGPGNPQGVSKWWSGISDGWGRINTIGRARLSTTVVSTITVPTVSTTSITNITSNNASGGGNVTYDGGDSVTACGVVWSTSPNPTVTSYTGRTTDGQGVGTFTSSITGLQGGTTYYVRAYATNQAGTAYGAQVSFTTLCQSDIIISGANQTCSQSEVLYTLSRAATNPTWSVEGGTLLTGATDQTALVRWTGTLGVVRLTEADGSACPGVAELAVTVLTQAAPAKPTIHLKGADKGINILICTTPSMTTYRWFRNGALVADAPEQFYVARANTGEYRVEITDYHGCPSTSDPVTVTAAKAAPALTLYPNPTRGAVTVEAASDELGEATLTISTLQGLAVHHERLTKGGERLSHTLSLPALPPGVYAVTLRVAEGAPLTTKLTVQ